MSTANDHAVGSEVLFDVYSSGIDCAVRATHVPSGYSVTVGGAPEYECRAAAPDALSTLLVAKNVKNVQS